MILDRNERLETGQILGSSPVLLCKVIWWPVFGCMVYALQKVKHCKAATVTFLNYQDDLVIILSLFNSVCCLVLDIAAFERLMGPCMDIMKRNINHYDEQLGQIFGSNTATNEARRWTVTLKSHMTGSHQVQLVIYVDKAGNFKFLCQNCVQTSNCLLKRFLSLCVPLHTCYFWRISVCLITILE